MCVFKNHAFIYFLRPPSWSGTLTIYILKHLYTRYLYIHSLCGKHVQYVTQRLFIFIKTIYILTMTLLRCTVLHIANKPKGCFVSRRFVPPDVFSPRMFCLPDVLSRRTFCPYGRFVPRMLCLRLLCHRMLCLRTFCSSGRFVSGCFVWTPNGSPSL